ncbi:MAG: Gfo/Idh/MocA family oxidoreductase [Firmicutes bacterium]|nr:Gfo/Idh/MocA family oxidoreductase [Bacillota bacterium]
MINIVVCGLGGISKRVAQGIQFAENAHLYGICSRSLEKAKAWQQEIPVEHIFTSYQDVYADADVDCLYFCTPNNTHYSLVKDALCNGKSVMCEKPMVYSFKQLEELFKIAESNHCFLMEAQKTMFSPLLEKVLEAIENGIIGKIKHVDASYCFDMRAYADPDQWHFQKGGGVAGDIGVYPICGVYKIANSAPASIQIFKKNYQEYPVDFVYEAYITFENGVTGSIHSNWIENKIDKGSMFIFGEQGTIEIPAFWKGKIAYVHNARPETIEVSFDSDFTAEIEHAASCIEKGLCASPMLSFEKTKEILSAYQE